MPSVILGLKPAVPDPSPGLSLGIELGKALRFKFISDAVVELFDVHRDTHAERINLISKY